MVVDEVPEITKPEYVTFPLPVAVFIIFDGVTDAGVPAPPKTFVNVEPLAVIKSTELIVI